MITSCIIPFHGKSCLGEHWCGLFCKSNVVLSTHTYILILRKLHRFKPFTYRNTFKPIPGMMHICIPLYFVWHCRGAYVYSLETFFNNTYITHFGKISWLKVVAFDSYGHLGIKLWPIIRNFWSKLLEIERAIKSRVYIHFRSNFYTILIMML